MDNLIALTWPLALEAALALIMVLILHCINLRVVAVQNNLSEGLLRFWIEALAIGGLLLMDAIKELEILTHHTAHLTHQCLLVGNRVLDFLVATRAHEVVPFLDQLTGVAHSKI